MSPLVGGVHASTASDMGTRLDSGGCRQGKDGVLKFGRHFDCFCSDAMVVSRHRKKEHRCWICNCSECEERTTMGEPTKETEVLRTGPVGEKYLTRATRGHL